MAKETIYYKYKVTIKYPMTTEEIIIKSTKDNDSVKNMIANEHWSFLVFEKRMFNKQDILSVEILDD